MCREKEDFFKGKKMNALVEGEIEDLAEKPEELKKSSKCKDLDVWHCNNFDKQERPIRLSKPNNLLR